MDVRAGDTVGTDVGGELHAEQNAGHALRNAGVVLHSVQYSGSGASLQTGHGVGGGPWGGGIGAAVGL